MRVVLWGTYDLDKPRTRIILEGLRCNGIDVISCHSGVWDTINDKSQITGAWKKILALLKWLSRYPRLLCRYLALPDHDAVIVGYLGHLDVLLLRPFALLRRRPVVWDAFLSLYNTVVEDRRLISPRNPLAACLFLWEWLACRAADRIVLDTASHAGYFIKKYGLAKDRLVSILVGAEDRIFAADADMPRNRPATVLFYGQFIPLHGVETIIEAARLSSADDIDWVLIGRGQESARIDSMLACGPACRVRRLEWVPYNELRQWITCADICLGIFGTSDKAARVIPNKVFQILMCGKPLITRDSAAIRELLSPEMPGIMLVPAGDPHALAEAVKILLGKRPAEPLHQALKNRISPAALGKEWGRMLASLTHRPTDS